MAALTAPVWFPDVVLSSLALQHASMTPSTHMCIPLPNPDAPVTLPLQARLMATMTASSQSKAAAAACSAATPPSW
jgi:hypothetical protein